MAAINGLRSADFAVDMGFAQRKIIDQNPEALERLFDLAGLSGFDRQNLLSWTGQKAGNVRMSYRGEIIVSRAIRNPIVRGCPVCLREDAAQNKADPVGEMVMRGDWQFQAVQVCIKHRQPLIQLWQENRPGARYDISQRLREVKDAIVNGRLDQPEIQPTEFDRWLALRLQTGEDQTWLATQTLFAATTFCSLLGHQLSNKASDDKSGDYEIEQHAAYAAGFEVASKGEDEIRKALNALAANASGEKDQPYKAFGALYSRLSREYSDDDSFVSFRQLLRNCILGNWAFPSGTILLGEAIPQRRFHSLRSAAKETGIGQALLEQFLVEAGALEANDARPAIHKLFDAQKYESLLSKLPTLIGPIEMRKIIGATRHELRTLEEEGLLRTHTGIASVKSPFLPQDGIEFLDHLLSYTDVVSVDDALWETIQQAKKRSGLTVRAIIEAIQEGKLSAGLLPGPREYHGVVVLKREIDGMKATKVIQSSRVSSHIDETGLIPAAQFARTLGVRDKGVFHSFLANGHSPSREITRPENGRKGYYLSPADIEEFHRRFISLTSLVEETGLHRNTLLARINSSGLQPFAPQGQAFGRIYLRTDVEAHLTDLFQ